MACYRIRCRHPRRCMLSLSISTILLLLTMLSASLHVSLFVPFEFKLRAHADDAVPRLWTERTDRLGLTELRRLVAGKRGFYVRDWSVGLGWNNLRYIVEASLLHAKLLNRVLVLPSFVYARSCEFPMEVCSQYGLFVERSDVVGWDRWSGRPVSPLAWQIPIQIMLDLPHLRETYPVILASEFFELHGLDTGFESLAGDWNRGDLENVTFPSIHVIPNEEYDPPDVVRVDTLRGLPRLERVDDRVRAVLDATLGERDKVLSWEDAVRALRERGEWKLETDMDAERVITSGDWLVAYTFQGVGGMDYTKTVIDPIRQVVPRSRVRGLVEDYSVAAEVLLLEGETHLGRKPAGLLFTTPSARDTFADLVLHGFRPVSPLRHLVHTLAARMRRRCGGRTWMAAHMRRGDFVTIGWAMEKSLEAHLARIKARLDVGRGRLTGGGAVLGSHVPGDAGDLRPPRRLPRDGDPFFLATDERDAESLAYLRNNSAVLIHDLLTIEDRRTFGWPLLFTDVLALVEQSLAVEAAFFYGHALSSFTGGVSNMRAAQGADPRTVIID